MPAAYRASVLALLMIGVLLVGCATQTSDSDDYDDVDQGEERLRIDPGSPGKTELTATQGEWMTFVADCEPPGQPEEIVLEWELAIRAQEVVDQQRDFQASNEAATFTVTFEQPGEHLVTAVCTTANDRTQPHVWNVTVEERPPVNGSTNDTNETDQTSSTNNTTPEANLTLHFVDVGQGDGIVVHHPDHTAVYDTGRWSGESETAVRDHLQAEDADPDTLVISHPDADHAGGCDIVLDAFAIEAIYHPGLSKDTQTWADCEDAIQAEGAPVHTDADVEIGQTLNWTTTGRVQLLHVDGSASDANAGSIVLEFTYGNVGLVLAGDLTCKAEDEIVQRGLVDDFDVVQVAHHGSSTSTCSSWLEATQPSVGVISVGDNNYGHPTEEVLDRLDNYGVDTYRTDHHGTVEVTTNGTTWDVRTETGTGSYEHGTSDEGGTSGSNASVSIGQIHEDAEGDDNENLNDEWVEIVNDGTDSVDMSGWTLSDEADHTYTFPSEFTLEPNAIVKVHTGSGEDTATDLYWGRGRAVWNNSGDTATLENGTGTRVDKRAY